MFDLRDIYALPKRWTQQLRTRQIQKRQWSDASETELRKIARSSSGYTADTSYSHSMRVEEADFAHASTDHETYTSNTRFTSGWRFGAINGAISVCVVFFINLVVTILVSARKDGVFFDGDCDRASKLNTGLHLLINILSTILLSSSNYCMQCLSAPTRKEIDDAHSKGKWLDIGVQSVHNLRNIDRRRAVVWLLLGLSSLPLHLFYNSAVFLSISSNNYFALSVRESFINSPDCGECGAIFSNTTVAVGNYNTAIPDVARMMLKKARNNKLDRLSNLDCIREYAEPIQTKRRNVLLVTADDRMPAPNVTANGTANIYAWNDFDASAASIVSSAMNSYGWICSDDPTWRWTSPCSTLIDAIKSKPDDWKVGHTDGVFSDSYNPTYPVDYCLSETSEPRCKVQVMLTIAILVTVLNIFKAVFIFYTALGTKENPLMTMGDAVASFLERRDGTTKEMCLLSIRDVKTNDRYFPAGPITWKGEQRRFKDVTSRRRRSVTFIA
ncbi:uncharacterized protein N0V89_008633 [Didymosphaeria variabile]|uniref:DUF6536 domain-containing protein n=1 Tax=Didymosphaeria variabile TaxID=1932322 RepID=A0A9W8XHX2_9PLEO|nr:uncharacterized protein N0V89_008633 [Didymosphaeria variabile]KAJ4350012.1 hypothetical protein N0V89_008633 [Didymosphaeria variabile]